MFSKRKKYNISEMLKTPLVLNESNDLDILVFRRLIEAAMKLGYWGGFVGLS